MEKTRIKIVKNQKIDFQYFQGQKLMKKKNKDFKNFEKNNSPQNSLINILLSNKIQFLLAKLITKN